MTSIGTVSMLNTTRQPATTMLQRAAGQLPAARTRTTRCACSRAARRDILTGVTAVSWVLLHQQQAPAEAAATLTERLQHAVRPAPLMDLQTDYDRYSSTYDNLDGGAASEALGFPQLRAELLQQAKGDVLEVAVGTGLNLPFYSWTNLTSYSGIDLSPGMLSAAQARAQQLVSSGALPAAAAAVRSAASSSSSAAAGGGSLPAAAAAEPGQLSQFNLQQADAAQLPFPNASFDTVTDTCSLCVIDRPLAALQEMRRVLRPGGRLLLLEHSRSDNPLLAGYQDLTEPLVTPLSKGCVWNQDLPQLLAAAGLRPISFTRTLQGTISSIVAEAAPTPS